VYIVICWFGKAYPHPNAHHLILVTTCADEDETEFVKEYIKKNNIYIKLGMLSMLFVNILFCLCELLFSFICF